MPNFNLTQTQTFEPQKFENLNDVDLKMTAVETKAKIDNCLPFPEMEPLSTAKIVNEFAKIVKTKILELETEKRGTGLFGVRSSSNVLGPDRRKLVLVVLVILVLVIYYLKTKKKTLSRQRIPDIQAINTRGGHVKIKNASINSALFRQQEVSNGNTVIKVKMKRRIFYKAMNRLRIISVIWLIIATVSFGSIGTLSSNSRQPNSTYAMIERRIRNIENQSFNQNEIPIEQFLDKKILINEKECTGEKEKDVNIVKDIEKSNIIRTKKNRKPEKKWNTKIHSIRDFKTDFANESEGLEINLPPTIVRNRIKTT
jgi:hypothetical protein